MSVALATAMLLLLESRRSTTLELLRAGLLLYLTTGLILAWRRRTRERLSPRDFALNFLRRDFAFERLVLLTNALLIAVVCLEGIGYEHRQVLFVVKASFYVFILALQLASLSRGRLGVLLLLAQLVLPWNAVFFSSIGYIQPLLAFVFLLFVYECLRRDSNGVGTPVHWFDLGVAAYVALHLILTPFAQNLQDAVSRLTYFALLMGIYVLVRRFFHSFAERRWLLGALVAIGAVYTLAALLFFALDLLGLPYGWSIDKTQKGKLITTQIAQHFMCMAPVTLLMLRRGQSRFMQAFLLLLSAGSVLALLFTLARGSIGGLGVAVLAISLGAAMLRDRRLLLLGGAVAVLLVSAIGLLFYFYSDNTDLTGLFTLQQRFGLWFQSWTRFLESPLTGTGAFISYNLFSVRSMDLTLAATVHETAVHVHPWTAPHNLYLALLVSGGVFALGIFLGLFTVALYTLLLAVRRVATGRAVQTALFGIVFVAFLVVGLTESLISTPIPHFWIWLTFALFAVHFRRELSLFFGSFRFPIPTGFTNVTRYLLLAIFSLLSLGHFFLYRGTLPVARLQPHLKGILILEPAGPAPTPAVRASLERARSDLTLARALLPYDWRPRQLLGEIDRVAAGRSPERLDELTERSAAHYDAAIRLNPRFSLLWVRLAEIYDYHREHGREPARFQAQRLEAERNIAEHDPHFIYRRFWQDPVIEPR